MRRSEQVAATREALLDAAERLFAERGLHAVSNRDIATAAGQGNTAAVNYHFGVRADLVSEIARRHSSSIDVLRSRALADVSGSLDLHDWVGCLVRPVAQHLEDLGVPSWYARFTSQVVADPELSAVIMEQSLSMTPELRELDAGLSACVATLSIEERRERMSMARHLVAQMFAERERALAGGRPTHRRTWVEAGDAVIEAIVAIWMIPASEHVGRPGPAPTSRTVSPGVST